MIPIKSAKEADKMRRSCRTASEILDKVSELVRPGITTKEVDEAAASGTLMWLYVGIAALVIAGVAIFLYGR